MATQQLRAFDPLQVRRQTNINKVQLGRFDETFSDIGIPRLQAHHHKCFKQAQPFSRGGWRYSGIVCQTGNIEQLSNPTGTQAHKSIKPHQVMNLQQRPQIALNKRLVIRAVM